MKYLFLILSLLISCSLFAQTKLSPTDFAKQSKQKKAQLLDVRTAAEYATESLPKSKNIDWNDKTTFKESMKGLDKKKPIYVYCLSGGRSAQAAKLLTQDGFEVYELEGGLMKLNAEKKEDNISANSKDIKGLDRAGFEKITKSHNLVLIDFTAKWCGPCQTIKPYLEKIAADKSYKAKVIYIDADTNGPLLKELKVNAIPRLQLFKAGVKVWDHTGGIDKQELIEVLKKNR